MHSEEKNLHYIVLHYGSALPNFQTKIFRELNDSDRYVKVERRCESSYVLSLRTCA